MNEPASANSLWAFACEHYSMQGEQARLIEAQNTYQISICAVLWSLWLDAHQKPLSLSAFKSGLALCESVDSKVLSPLRRIRQQPPIAITPHFAFSHTKKSLLHTELTLERQLLESLESLTYADRFSKASHKAGFLATFLESQPEELKVWLRY